VSPIVGVSRPIEGTSKMFRQGAPTIVVGVPLLVLFEGREKKRETPTTATAMIQD